MNKKIIIILTIIIIAIGIVLIGFLRRTKTTRQLPSKPTIIEEKSITTPTPIPIATSEINTQISASPSETPLQITSEKYRLLFKEPLFYIDLQYPLFYVYDPEQEVIKYLNLEDETYKEIAKISNLKNIWLSEDKTHFVIETNNGFSLLDLKSDKLINLPYSTKKIILATNIILYLNDGKNISYLAYFINNKTTKIRDLGILNPEFALLKDGVLIYEKDSPVFFLDFRNPDKLKLFLENQVSDVLVNKNQDLMFVIFKKENIWQSEIIDLNKKVKYAFSWATIKDKCSFDDVLICALPADLNNFDPEDWYLLTPNFDEKIIIYDPKNDKIKEINLEANFYFVRPKLTPLGIIAWNRLDAKFYLLKLE